MFIVLRDVVSKLSKRDRRKVQILLRWATELHGRKRGGSVNAEMRYAALAWLLERAGFVRWPERKAAPPPVDTDEGPSFGALA